MEHPDHRIRVAFVGLAPLVRSVVETIVEKQGDMRVAGSYDGPGDVADPHGAADVYVLGAATPAQCAEFATRLASGAARRVVGISDDGRRTLLCELRPTTVPLGELSAAELLTVIRGDRGLHEGA